MNDRDPELVRHIVAAVGRLSELVDGGRAAFDESWILQSAAERQLQIIGEAAGNLSDELRGRLPGLPFAEARGMKNVVTHRYFDVDHNLVWKAMSQDAPQFASELAQFAASEAEQEPRRYRGGGLGL